MPESVIWPGMQLNGPAYEEQIRRYHIGLNKRLDTHCQNTHSPEIARYYVTYRFSGQFGDFGFLGITRIRRNHRDKSISCEVGFNDQLLAAHPDDRLHVYLTQVIAESMDCCIRRLEKDRAVIDGQSMRRDIDAAVRDYLRGLPRD